VLDAARMLAGVDGVDELHKDSGGPLTMERLRSEGIQFPSMRWSTVRALMGAQMLTYHIG
jgi:hypothetical protein